MIEKNNQQNKTLFVFDYDDTIAFGTEEMFYTTIDQFFGDGETARMVHNQHNLNGVVEDFIVNYPHDKKEIVNLLKYFINNSNLYKELKKVNNTEVQKTLKKIEELSNNPELINKSSEDLRRYFMEEIVGKVLAYANVYVYNLKPQKAFFDIVEKTRKQSNKFELVINTYKHEAFIKNELQTLSNFYKSQGQEQEVEIIKFLLENGKVFGANAKHSKGMKDTIDYIIKTTGNVNKIDNIYILGDGRADERSYLNTKQLPGYENKNINFLLINGMLLNNILKEKTNNLQQDTTKLEALENKLMEQKQKLEQDKNIKMFSNLEQVLTYFVNNNIIKEQNNNIMQRQ